MFRFARVSNTFNETTGLAYGQVQKTALETHEDIPHYQHFGFASSPVQGCNVVIANYAGDNNRGVIIASNDTRYRMKNLSAGDSVIYDANGQSIHLSNGTICNIVINSQLNITAPNITINGNIQLNGSLNATGDVVANSISLENHVHGGIYPGSSDTSKPV